MRRIACLIVCLMLVLLTSSHSFAGYVGGKIYHDADKNSRSMLGQVMFGPDKPLAGIEVKLLDGVDETSEETDARGIFIFSDIPVGHYFLDPVIDASYPNTTHNRSLRLPDAIREGQINILTIGDSIGQYYSDTPYPEWLATHLGELASVDLNNQSAPGSRSWEWLPGADEEYYENRILPYIADVDLVTITLGGNDADVYIQGMDPDNLDIMQIILNFLANPDPLLKIFQNVRTLVNLIHDENPDADVVYMVYPNYVNSSYILPMLGDFDGVVETILKLGLMRFRTVVGQAEPVVLADMLEYWDGVLLDPYFADQVHPNDEGHRIIGEFMFRSLGGVIIDEDRTDDTRMMSFYAPEFLKHSTRQYRR